MVSFHIILKISILLLYPKNPSAILTLFPWMFKSCFFSLVAFLTWGRFSTKFWWSLYCLSLYLLILRCLLSNFSIYYYSLPFVTRGKRDATRKFVNDFFSEVGFSIPPGDQELAEAIWLSSWLQCQISFFSLWTSIAAAGYSGR